MASADASMLGESTAAKPAVPMPSDVTNSFSISRSCVVASTFGSGSTGLRAERNVAVSAGTFSNS